MAKCCVSCEDGGNGNGRRSANPYAKCVGRKMRHGRMTMKQAAKKCKHKGRR